MRTDSVTDNRTGNHGLATNRSLPWDEEPVEYDVELVSLMKTAPRQSKPYRLGNDTQEKSALSGFLTKDRLHMPDTASGIHQKDDEFRMTGIMTKMS